MVANPYNCTLPGNLVVGYEDIRREVREDLRNGKSFAVLGGRRCGKTSLLLQLERDLSIHGLASFRPLPRFLDIQGLGGVTVEHLFRSIYQQIVLGTKASPWTLSERGSEYQHFLTLLDLARPALEEIHGKDWLVILLVDELDSAVARLPDDQFFQNLRNLLMVSRFHRYFRLVASGVKEMNQLITSGSSPLNNLCHVYLHILTPADGTRLIGFGFPEGLNIEAEMHLFQLTGLHPYLLQGLLEKLRKKAIAPNRLAVDQAATEFLREHKDFRRWLDGFDEAERAVYQLLAESEVHGLSETELRHRLSRSLRPKLDEAITVLSFHSVIDDTDPDRVRISSQLFRKWWLQNAVPVGCGSTPAKMTPASLDDAREAESEQPSSSPQVPEETTKTSAPAAEILPLIPDHVLVGRQPFGKGGYGQVWLAANVMGTHRAVKVVRRNSFPEAHPFEREFNGIKKYEPISRGHHGLVQILHVGRNDGSGYFYYVMELGDDESRGQNIDPQRYVPKNLARELSRRGRFPLAECVQLGLALTEALVFLHAQSLIHRDIKPSNIIFVNGAPKLADIGLVTTVSKKPGDITWVGTEGFFPPEGPGSPSSDLYGLGKLLYQMFTGCPCSSFPELPSDIVQGTKQKAFHGLNKIILKACHPALTARYQASTFMRDDLLKLRDYEAI